jgi:hypothetical protein
MGCNCGRAPTRARASSTIPRTSADYTVAGSYQSPQTPPEEPMATYAVTEEHEIPVNARYVVTNSYQVAYFAGHLQAFGWQGVHGGKLRTVRR